MRIQHFVSIKKINIKKTQWILVLTGNDSVNHEDIESDIPEGVHLLYLKLDIRVSTSWKSKETSLTLYSSSRTLEDEVRVNIFLAMSPGDGYVVLKEAARWSSSSGLVKFRTLKDELFFDFHGRKLYVSCLHKPGVFEVYSRTSGAEATTLEEASGYATDMMLVLQQRLNFTNALRCIKGFGVRLPNGTWNGMVGALVREEADLSPLDFTPTFDRSMVVDMSECLGTDPIIIISQAPRPLVKPFLLLEVFTPQVWASVVSAGVLTGIILWLLEFPVMSLRQLPAGASTRRRWRVAEGSSWDQNEEGEDGNARDGSEDRNLVYRWSVWRAFALAATALKLLVTQASHNWPIPWSPRILSATFFLVVISVAALYQGYIIAFLAVPRSTKPLDTPDDLMDRLDVMAPVARVNTVYYKFLMTFPPFRPIAEKLRLYEGSFLNTWEFFNLIDIGEVILIDTYSSAFGRKANFEKRTETCKFHVARDVLQPALDVWVYPMNSVFGRQFDQTIKWLRSFGMMDHFKAKYYAASCEKGQRRGDTVPFTLTQMQGAFYILVVGLVLALLMLFLEFLMHYCI
ncbi:glutamate receptor 1-like [Oratosquilla oratoria]|uniref:glutamate receptor 1-like n=1 Tax=Oratosquilla oratoria TaxID=337810 RepID=UPI003F766C4D